MPNRPCKVSPVFWCCTELPQILRDTCEHYFNFQEVTWVQNHDSRDHTLVPWLTVTRGPHVTYTTLPETTEVGLLWKCTKWPQTRRVYERRECWLSSAEQWRYTLHRQTSPMPSSTSVGRHHVHKSTVTLLRTTSNTVLLRCLLSS